MKPAQWWSALQARYQFLRTRERALVVATLMAAVGFLGDLFVYQGLQRSIAQGQAEQQGLQARIRSEVTTQQAAISAASQDPNLQLVARRETLHAEITELDAQLAEKVSGLVPPSEMALMLKGLLASQGGVRLVKLQSLAPTPLNEGVGNQSPNDDGVAALYRHGVRLELEGNYLDAWAYLRRIESMPFALLWDRVSFDVTESQGTRPRGKMVIEVHTLSDSERWISS